MQKMSDTLTMSTPAWPWRDYLSMTKPRVNSLLLLTTLAAMLLTSDTTLTFSLILATLVGGYLAAGGAGVINCYLDRDIDALMGRTGRRPLPARRIEPIHALQFGVVLSVLSFFVLWFGANLLAAVLALVGILCYVFVYTYWLKRRSPQNIVIGGAAGAIPPLVGWAAASNSLSLLPILLFLIIFLWTPPHFWALALVKQYDYARAGVPMLPVVRGQKATCDEILHYTILLVVASTLPTLLGFLGGIYLLSALSLGIFFLSRAIELQRRPSIVKAWRFYRYSLLYLALLFVLMLVDRHSGSPLPF